ncbi:psychosine receptor isoform X2 [Mustela erminea]|uniref:psychosine receptor isoform X2 n=1 Tax=Mustela erminea TaxID=36723 RepID=UPI00138695E8|nr:psychosine receptor isoform X2 [Mustela erminea]
MELLKISQRLNALKCPAVWVSFSSRCKQIYPAPRWTRSSPQETWEASYLQTELRVCEAVYQLPAVQASRTISWLISGNGIAEPHSISKCQNHFPTTGK